MAPSKHETLAQRWLTVGPTSLTLGQQYIDVVQMSHVCWAVLTLKALSTIIVAPNLLY